MNAVLQPKHTEVDLQSAAAGEAALRAFWQLARAWSLSTAEQPTLLGVGKTTLYQWKKGRVGALDLAAAEIKLGVDYPLPVVDRAAAREKTLARYAVVKTAG